MKTLLVSVAAFGLGFSIAAAQTMFSNLRGSSMRRALLTALGLALLPLASSHAASFDGTWTVLQVCNSTQEGVPGYTWRYDATVKRGNLVGQYRLKGQRPSLTLQGEVKPDGSASLIAEGLPASSDFNTGSAPTPSRISFRVVATFEGTLGTGRAGVRGCKFTFNKH
jgi:hypothetical protein